MRCGISVEMSIMPINLALRNILRQKLRSGVTLMAVAFGVVGLILAGGFIQDIFIQLGELHDRFMIILRSHLVYN